MLVAALWGAPAVAGTEADAAIRDAAARIRTHAGDARLILVGEFHGTRETPDLVEMLVAGYAADGPVLLGLEVPRVEQASLDAYLRSDGGYAARTALRARSFWTKHDDQHDGRRSEDMLALIDGVRRLRAQGRDVALLAYDVKPGTPRHDPDARDAAMAERVRAASRALRRGRLLVLAGNMHAMLERPSDAPPEMPRPMGTRLRDLAPWSVRVTARAGDFWACRTQRGCGPSPADGAHARTGPAQGAYHYLYVLPHFTPARIIGASR